MTSKNIFLFLGLLLLCSCGKNEFDRKIKLEGEPNFRDLGEYKTSEGLKIKKGMLYRSGSLHKLTEADVAKLEELGIKSVVSFLTPKEIENHGEDVLPDGIRRYYLPIDGNNDETANLIVARKTGDFSKIPSDFNFQIHKILPESGKESYAQFMQIVQDAGNYPIVFHCSHGVHRTGTATALLLSSLGIPWDTIEEDYLLSDAYRKEESLRRIAYLDSLATLNPGVGDKEENLSDIESFYTLQPEYIQGTRDHILNEYGSFDAYLESIGISQDQIKEINLLLLED